MLTVHCALDFYPSGMTAFAIVSTLVCATWTDHSQVRWPVLVYMALACIVSSVCLLVWSSPTGLKFFAYCTSCHPALLAAEPRDINSGDGLQISQGLHMLDKRQRLRRWPRLCGVPAARFADMNPAF